MQERRHHIEAFDEYYAMGKGRTLRSLADHRGVTERTVKRWSTNFNWQERISQRDIENGKKILAKTDRAVVNTKADYRAEIKKDAEELRKLRQRYERLIANATAAIENGDIKAKTVLEMKQLSSSLKDLYGIALDLKKFDLALIGESGEQEMIMIEVKLPEGLTLDDI